MPDQKPSLTPVIPDYSALEADRQLWEDQSDLPIKAKAKQLAKPLARKHRYGSGSVYRQKGSPYWYISFWLNGKKHRESANTIDKREAEKQLQAKVADMQRGLYYPGSRSLTFADLEDLFALDYRRQERRSADKARGRVTNHLRPFFGNIKPAEITGTLIDKYIVKRQEEGAANGSVNRELAILSRMFTIALKRRFLTTRPDIPRLKEAQPRQGLFTEGEITRLLPHLPPYLQNPVRFAYLTSWRLASEVFTLEWSDVDRKKGLILLRAEYSKNGETRELPYKALPELVEIIDRQWENQKESCSLVFHRAGHQLVKPYKAWRKACQAAGLPGRLFHDLRRSGVTNLVEAGNDYRAVMKVSGHKDMSVFSRYRIVNQETVRAALGKLAKKNRLKTG